MTAPDPRLNEIQARVDKTPPDHGHTKSWLPAADVRYLLAELRKAHEALDELMYAANHKAADNQIGRWWAEVIRGPIIRHIGAEVAGKMGAAVAAAKGDEQ